MTNPGTSHNRFDWFYHFRDSIHTWFGDPYIRIQKWLFGFFITATVAALVYDLLVNQKAIVLSLLILYRATMIWLYLASAITILWFLGCQVLNLDLWIYYYVWVKHLFPFFRRFIRSSEYVYYLDLVRESFAYSKKRDLDCPVLIRREHLMRRRFWPDWAFSIVVIDQPDTITLSVVPAQLEAKLPKKWVMTVDLEGVSYGICNNQGKAFLRDRFKDPGGKGELIRLSQEYFSYLDVKSKNETPLSLGESGKIVPFRWASGGYLPIVCYQQRPWAVLFFRDISPIGLNIANGASENREEYKNLNRLIGREFSEEVIFLRSAPFPKERAVQHPFHIPNQSFETGDPVMPYLNEAFYKEHARLRSEQDGIAIQLDRESEWPMLHGLNTPFDLRVRYHTPDLKHTRISLCPNVIFSLNPLEQGIEIIWLTQFNLNEGNYLLDGEYNEAHKVLIRRPVILVSMDYLKGIYGAYPSLGELLPEVDCKRLPPIPHGEFVLFDQDIDLRKKRLDTLEKTPTGSMDKKQREDWDWEVNLHKNWLETYEHAFRQAAEGDIEHEALRTLCPVTWKTLEIIFGHNIEYP